MRTQKRRSFINKILINLVILSLFTSNPILNIFIRNPFIEFDSQKFIFGVEALDNGVAKIPPLGWSSWNTFQFAVSDSLIREMADAIVSSGLAKAGYNYVLIDDGWPSCEKFNKDGSCSIQTPRNATTHQIIPDPTKFPNGIAALADYVHSKNLKFGIYTAVSKSTCGGYTASLHYEAIDAQTFASWGVDFVKHDTCNYDCGVNDGCIQNSTGHMRDGLNATGRSIVYYIDDGNNSSGPRLYNPFMHSADMQQMIKIADNVTELIQYWGPSTANIWKFWFDHVDTWESTIDNLHMMSRFAMYQSCGSFNTPDMVTIGQGGQTAGQYRVQMFLWSVLGSPIILGNDIRSINNNTLTLLTNPNILVIDQDSQCVQGSQVRSTAGVETWIKPLSDGTFAVALLNTLLSNMNITLYIAPNWNHGCGDFYPADLNSVSILDVYLQKDLGKHSGTFTYEVAGQDAALLKVTPV